MQAAASGRPAPAERADGRGVGHHAERVEPQLRDDVHALRHQVRRPHGQRAAEAGVRPALAEHPQPEPHDASLGGQPELGELHLPAPLHREHRLAARLGPLDRPAQLHGRQGDRGVVGEDPGLAAEGAADVRRHDPDLVLLQAEGVGQQVARQVRVLGGHVRRHGTRLAGRVRRRLDQDGVALDRGDRDPLVDHPDADHDVGARERVGAVLVVPAGCHVGAEALELEGRVVGHRRLDVGDHRQVVVVDVDQLGRVDGLGPGLGDDEGDRVAHEADLADGERGPRHLVVHVGERLQGAAAEVLGGVDGQHARRLRGLGRVETRDRGVCEGAAHEDRVPDTVHAAVVDEGPGADEELPVLDPSYLCSQQRSRHGRSLRPNRRAPPRWVRSAVGAPL